jgi:hypothetical protein
MKIIAKKDEREVIAYKKKMIYSFRNNNFKEAEELAYQFLELTKVNETWNYEDAVHHSHLLLGRIALKKGNVELAEEFLLKAAETKGTAVLKTFGPNMMLAKELLVLKRKRAVLQYISLTKNFWFWIYSWRKTSIWKKQILRDEIPDFGGNLIYGMFLDKKDIREIYLHNAKTG